MTVFADVKTKITGLARSQQEEYSAGADRPLAGYTGAMAVYAAVITGIAAGARVTRRQVPEGMTVADVVLTAAATHKLSRLLAKDPVTSPLRAPFTSYRGTAGPSELTEQVRGSGARKAVGELVTCPLCTGVWVATGLTAGLIFLPRATRLASGTLAALAGADLLHFGYSWLQSRSGERGGQ